jgi:glycolate oxidase FAD binding subunit
VSARRRDFGGGARHLGVGGPVLMPRGELLHFGGQVMKNVAGFDVSRLLCGSLGILGLITQVSLKVMPKPRCETTLRFECDASRALQMFSAWRPQPLPVSATAWIGGAACVRLSGSPSALRSACRALGGEELSAAQSDAWWGSIRDQTHAAFGADDGMLWRVCVPATAPLDACSADVVEWSGALRWMRSERPAAVVRERATACGGTATRWRGRDAPMFHPLAAFTLELHRRLKHEFDPNGVFNPGRLVAGL